MVYALEMLYIIIIATIVTHSAAVVNCIHSIALDVYKRFQMVIIIIIIIAIATPKAM